MAPFTVLKLILDTWWWWDLEPVKLQSLTRGPQLFTPGIFCECTKTSVLIILSGVACATKHPSWSYWVVLHVHQNIRLDHAWMVLHPTFVLCSILRQPCDCIQSLFWCDLVTKQIMHQYRLQWFCALSSLIFYFLNFPSLNTIGGQRNAFFRTSTVESI